MRIIICIFNGNSTGWFLYFGIALSVGLEILSAKGLVLLNLDILRFLTAFEKKIFKSSSFCSSCVVTFNLPLKWFSHLTWFCQKIKVLLFSKTAYYRQYALHSSLHNNLFWFFLKEKRSVYLVLNKMVYSILSRAFFKIAVSWPSSFHMSTGK